MKTLEEPERQPEDAIRIPKETRKGELMTGVLTLEGGFQFNQAPHHIETKISLKAPPRLTNPCFETQLLLCSAWSLAETEHRKQQKEYHNSDKFSVTTEFLIKPPDLQVANENWTISEPPTEVSFPKRFYFLNTLRMKQKEESQTILEISDFLLTPGTPSSFPSSRRMLEGPCTPPALLACAWPPAPPPETLLPVLELFDGLEAE